MRFALIFGGAVGGFALFWICGLLLGIVLSDWIGTDYFMVVWVPFLVGLTVCVAIFLGTKSWERTL